MVRKKKSAFELSVTGKLLAQEETFLLVLILTTW
jgi:hypothetical protein